MSWTAKIPPEEMAVSLCCDLLKKMDQLREMPTEVSSCILEGVVDGLLNHTIPHPYEGIPYILKSMCPNYVVGHSVGSTWRRVAKEWQELATSTQTCDISLRHNGNQTTTIPTLLEHMMGLGSGTVGEAVVAYLSSPDCSPRTRDAICSFALKKKSKAARDHVDAKKHRKRNQ